MLVRRHARCWWMPSRCKTPMQVGELVVVVLQFVIFVAGSCCSCSCCSCCLFSVDGMTCFIPGMILPLSLPLLPYLWLSLSGPFLYSCLSPFPPFPISVPPCLDHFYIPASLLAPPSLSLFSPCLDHFYIPAYLPRPSSTPL